MMHNSPVIIAPVHECTVCTPFELAVRFTKRHKFWARSSSGT